MSQSKHFLVQIRPRVFTVSLSYLNTTVNCRLCDFSLSLGLLFEVLKRFRLNFLCLLLLLELVSRVLRPWLSEMPLIFATTHHLSLNTVYNQVGGLL